MTHKTIPIKRVPSEPLMEMAEANVVLFGFQDLLSKTIKSWNPAELLRAAADFVEFHAGVESARFTFSGTETRSLRDAAETLGRHAERDPALAELRKGGASRLVGERVYFEIRGNTRLIGYLSVRDATLLDEEQRYRHHVVELIASLLGVLSENAILNEHMRDLARRDPLTGLLNRRGLEESMQEILKQPGPAVFFMIDLDRFKVVNDTFGHDVGDQVLRSVAEVLSTGARGEDVVARYGGEELTVILRGVEIDVGRIAAESLRARVEAIDWRGLGLNGPITVSIGASRRLPGDSDPADWIRRADEVLYLAKSGGRNRVVVWTPDGTGMQHTEWVLSPREGRAVASDGPSARPAAGWTKRIASSG